VEQTELNGHACAHALPKAKLVAGAGRGYPPTKRFGGITLEKLLKLSR
jgi:hypothetical protein